MEKKYQIFISSTYTDLKQEREMVLKTILTMYHIPIGMELFSAADEDQWQIIQDTIDYSDYYILILGHRYGSVDNSGIGFTEKEYDYALHKKIPILSFVLDDKAPRTSEQREIDPIQLQKFNTFREKVLKNSKMSEFWNQPDELGRKVAVALPKTFKRTPGIGWVRSDNAASPEVLEEIALLSKENRDLRNQLTSLMEGSSRKPELECTIKAETLIFLNNLNLSFPNFIKEITLEDIPIEKQKYISNDEIIEYNNLLKVNKKTIDDYNSKSIHYNRLDSQRFYISLEIHNKGTLKAHSIYIHLFFPKELILVDESDKIANTKPEVPIKTDLYPIYIANQRFEDAKKKLVFPDLLPQSFRNYSPGNYSPFIGHSLQRGMFTPRKDWCSINYEDNSIKIHISELLHNMMISFDNEISVIPLTSGNIAITGNIICEEYATKEDLTLTIIIPSE